ncbi:hypothetical protein J2794_006609 [Paraburkholderia terricola]|uniref:hypothetical protein n=1 Tax=Paraburkholderia terricola TaxID=169427 RepID=UPI002856889B|nr:hypothetical protein [Paraburkholderia terricola]MDR6450468.1 hypothetical protein [Paraburkholderia terricola]
MDQLDCSSSSFSWWCRYEVAGHYRKTFIVVIKTVLTSAFAALMLSACAPSIPVQGTEFLPVTATQQRVRVVSSVTVRLASGYSREVHGDSLWQPVGQIPQGVVLKPVGAVFTIEGRQVHEAYLVTKANTLVGFFLPGESHFSPLDPPQSITIERTND